MKFLLSFVVLNWGLSCFANEIETTTALQPGETCSADQADVEGLSRTDRDWFNEYLGLTFPLPVDGDDSTAIREKIMTTDVFTQAEVFIDKTRGDRCKINIVVSEKWTTIPVIRGAYGGGTPLAVIGAYETHASGKLYLLGFEARRYGTRPPGFFLFGKSPRAWQGSGSYGGELWLDRRRRAFFDDEGKIAGYADSEAWTAKLQWLKPAGQLFNLFPLQLGVHVELVQESPSSFTDKDLNEAPGLRPRDISTPSESERTTVAMPMAVIDNLVVDRMNMHGVRGLARIGGQTSKGDYFGATEMEGFVFQRWPQNLNLGIHGFAGSQGSDSLRNLYFLGGFDAVRGLPDGIHYGTKMSYVNAELRHVTAQWTYLEVQSAVFTDHGTAFSRPEDIYPNRETAVGIGVRLSVPQIYRMLIRIDYGWSVGNTKSQGFSIGLGQFFQPYRQFF